MQMNFYTAHRYSNFSVVGHLRFWEYTALKYWLTIQCFLRCTFCHLFNQKLGYLSSDEVRS